MLKHKRLLIGFGISLLVVSALAAATAFAETPKPKAGANSAYQNFLGKVAANLNISVEDLGKAITSARGQMMDEAVQSGKMTKEQASKLKERGKDGLGWQGFREKPFPPKAGFTAPPKVRVDLANLTAEALAKLTGKTLDQVKAELRVSKNLQKYLEDNKITREKLQGATAEVAKVKLDQAVKDGKLTQEQADRIIERLKNCPAKALGMQKHLPKGRGQAPAPKS